MSTAPYKYTTHYRVKDLIPKSQYISPYQKAKAAYRATQLGSPVLPQDKQALKEMIDKALADYSK